MEDKFFEQTCDLFLRFDNWLMDGYIDDSFTQAERMTIASSLAQTVMLSMRLETIDSATDTVGSKLSGLSKDVSVGLAAVKNKMPRE